MAFGRKLCSRRDFFAFSTKHEHGTKVFNRDDHLLENSLDMSSSTSQITASTAVFRSSNGGSISKTKAYVVFVVCTAPKGISHLT